MKNFLIDLTKSVFVAFVIVPVTIIGMCIGGEVYERKVKPWINKRLGV